MPKDKTKRKTEDGRPKVSPDECSDSWKKDMLELYKEGNSDVVVRATCFGGRVVSFDLWARWLEEEDGFSETVSYGRALSQVWWESVSKEHASGANTDANATSLIFNMCNRFKDDFQQRQGVEQTTTHNLSFKELEALRVELKESGINIEDL